MKNWWYRNDWMVYSVLTCMVMVFVVILLVMAIQGICNFAFFNVNMAEIEQLRSDVRDIAESQSEDVIGLAAEKNIEIVRWQQQNQMWWLDWMIPDGWDEVELIEQ